MGHAINEAEQSKALGFEFAACLPCSFTDQVNVPSLTDPEKSC